MTINIRNAGTMVQPKVRMLLCGPIRSGKTSIASTFPKPLFLFPANEGSEETVRGRQDVHYDIVDSRAKMDEVLAFLTQQHLAGTLTDWCGTVVCESWSHYSELVEAELTGGRTKGGASKTLYSEWATYAGHFQNIRATLWSLPVHVVITCLDKVKQDKDGQTVGHIPKLAGDMGVMLAGACDAVGYCEQVVVGGVGPTFRTHFCRWGAFDAGTRIRGMAQGTYPNFNFGEHVAPLI